MAQIDTTFVFQDRITIEHHTGNPIGSSGTNPKGPTDAPIIGSNVTALGNGGRPLNMTVGSQKIVNPA